MSAEIARCELCGEPMPPGETMFKFHGYSGPCPKPPLAAAGKKPRLFVRVPNSDGQLWYCGGPDLASAVKGLQAILECGGEDGDRLPVDLEIRDKSDEEVEKLAEV